jgi:hypothetical protein
MEGSTFLIQPPPEPDVHVHEFVLNNLLCTCRYERGIRSWRGAAEQILFALRQRSRRLPVRSQIPSCAPFCAIPACIEMASKAWTL